MALELVQQTIRSCLYDVGGAEHLCCCLESSIAQTETCLDVQNIHAVPDLWLAS